MVPMADSLGMVAPPVQGHDALFPETTFRWQGEHLFTAIPVEQAFFQAIFSFVARNETQPFFQLGPESPFDNLIDDAKEEPIPFMDV